MKMIRWELSLGLYPGFLFGYRQYINNEELKVDHVMYVFVCDICLSLYYE